MPLLCANTGTNDVAGWAGADGAPLIIGSGGDARGTGAVDLQTARTADTQVASGDYSCIPGGRENTASGTYSLAMGDTCTAGGNNSIAMGYISTTQSADSIVMGWRAVIDDSSPRSICMTDGSVTRSADSIAIGPG